MTQKISALCHHLPWSSGDIARQGFTSRHIFWYVILEAMLQMYDMKERVSKRRGYKLLLKRIKSAFPVKMHLSFITTKFHAILLSGFNGVVLTNCFSSIIHFRQISKFKKSVIQIKKVESKFPVDMHIYTLCPSLLQRFRKFFWAVSEELR